MAIENRNLTPGTKLVARYHKLPYRAWVVDGGDGKLRYRIADGTEFKSPSAAGTAITGKACNGWAFWSIATETPATEDAADQDADAGQKVEEPEPAAEKQLQLKARISKLPNQKGAPEGQVRWFCGGCKKSFTAPTGEKPAACPQGHQAA